MKKKFVWLFGVICMLALSGVLMAGCNSSSSADTSADDEAESEEVAVSDEDQAAADDCAAKIDAIYVQERTDETDQQCEDAKAAWDALTDEQKELVEGENADPDYFGRDTGDAVFHRQS